MAGNIGFGSTTTELPNSQEISEDEFRFNPRVGYQFDDHWTAGVVVGIDNLTSEDRFGDETEINTSRFGVFGRYTQGINKTFAFYGDLDLGVQSDETSFDGNTSSEADGFFAQFTPALFINFKNSFGVNISVGGLGYSSLENDDAKFYHECLRVHLW